MQGVVWRLGLGVSAWATRSRLVCLLCAGYEVDGQLDPSSRQSRRFSSPINLIEHHLFHRLNLPIEFFHSARVVKVPSRDARVFIKGDFRVREIFFYDIRD